MENVRITANSILDENQICRAAMLELIASNEAIAFVGAGLSADVYPPWRILLQKLRIEANNLATFRPADGLTEDDPLQFAEEIQRHFEARDGNLTRYYRILGQQFAHIDSACNSTYEKLVRLPFKGYVTTNYDLSLEAALHKAGNHRPDCAVVVKRNNKDAHKVGEFLWSLDDRKQDRRVAHLHGVENETQEIILSSSDYRGAYGFQQSHDGDLGVATQTSWTLHRKLVWTLLAGRRVIFFGFGFTDPYVNQILKDVADDLWGQGKAKHFAVVPLARDIINAAETKQRQFLEYGVQVVFYDNLDGSHLELIKIIDKAVERFVVRGSGQLSGAKVAGKPPKYSKRESFPKSLWSALQRFGKPSRRRKLQTDLKWLEEINSETEKDLQGPHAN